MSARDSRDRPWASALTWVAGVIAAATAGWLLWAHLTTPPLALAWPETSIAVVLLAATGVLLWSHWMRHRGETFRPQFGIGVAAGLAVVLGLASYAPCATPDQWPVVLIGLLNLFTGQVESALIGEGSLLGEASLVCRTHPLVFQLARLFGLVTLVFSALAVLAALVRPFLDRQRARFAHVVDVVVGLDATTLPLIKALCAERDAHVRRPDWYASRLRWGDRPWANPRPTVVVVHHDDTDPLAAEARAFGALVYVCDPTDTDELRPVLFWLWRVSVHRLYAVTASQRDNIAIVKAVESQIAKRHSSTDTTWLARRAVPRLIARFSDARDARDWRLQNVSSAGCLVDAVTPDGLLARALVDRVAEYEATDLLVSGDTPLTVAILDQVAQQRAFRHELQKTRRLKPGERSTPEENDLNEVYQLAFDEVTILAETAADLCDEWRASRAPGAAVPRLLEPTPAPDDWRAAVANVVARGGRPVLIVTDAASPQVSARAKRLSDRHPDLLVLRPSHNVQGVERLTAPHAATPPGGAVVRFGPTLVHDGRAPDDTWTVLARQQHEYYCGRRRVPEKDLPPSGREWKRGPDGLPDFFREDSLRQHRHLLMLVEAHGYRWRAARLTDPAPTLPPAVMTAVAKAEHERWADFRRNTGWRGLTKSQRSRDAAWVKAHKGELDRQRRNANLVPWDDQPGSSRQQLRDFNVWQDGKIIERLRLWGVEPWQTATSGSGS